MANDSQSWPLIVLMLIAIAAIVFATTMFGNFVRWLFA